jgi:hypothetical protein
MVFEGLMKGLQGLISDTVLDSLEERVDATLDKVRVHLEGFTDEIAEKVEQKIMAVMLLMLGLALGLVGLGMFLSTTVPALRNGIGFVMIGLLVILLAYFANKPRQKSYASYRDDRYDERSRDEYRRR